MKKIRLEIDGEKIEALLCNNPLTRAVGLMFRKKANALLLFKTPIEKEKAKIWMPFMRYSIWIYYISPSNEIVDKQFASPLSPLKPETWKVYVPRTTKKVKIKAILEIHTEEKINKKIKVGKIIKGL